MVDPTLLPVDWDKEVDGVYPHVFAFRIDDGLTRGFQKQDPVGGESSAQAAARLGSEVDQPMGGTTPEGSKNHPGQSEHSPDRMETSEQSSNDDQDQGGKGKQPASGKGGAGKSAGKGAGKGTGKGAGKGGGKGSGKGKGVWGGAG